MSEETAQISLTVNGEAIARTVPVRQHLVDFLRTDLGLTGSHLGCEHGVCGACSVRVDGRVVRGCGRGAGGRWRVVISREHRRAGYTNHRAAFV
jgi:aerobic-type carbon monoxide dehydrogenase small subunit (CoxS/CutS family)